MKCNTIYLNDNGDKKTVFRVNSKYEFETFQNDSDQIRVKFDIEDEHNHYVSVTRNNQMISQHFLHNPDYCDYRSPLFIVPLNTNVDITKKIKILSNEKCNLYYQQNGDHQNNTLIIQKPVNRNIIIKVLEDEQLICQFNISPEDDYHVDSDDVCLFCNPKLLEAASLSPLFSGKQFVDMKMITDKEIILDSFIKMAGQYKSIEEIPVETIERFFRDNFGEIELTEIRPVDYNERLPREFEERIKNEELLEMCREINRLWLLLSKKLPQDLWENNTTSYLLPKNNFMVVPGGIFKETYYWDTYFILKGFHLLDMEESVLKTIENYQDFIEKNGYVPNGNRCYYKGRSQPPLFSHMVKDWYEKTKDLKKLGLFLPSIVKEYAYWMEKRVVDLKKDGKTYKLNRYYSDNCLERPESWKEDHKQSKKMSNQQKNKFLRNKKACAESGWDFTSRFMTGGVAIQDLDTTNIIPVDLNSIMYGIEKNLSQFHGIIGKTELSNYYDELAEKRKEAIYKIHYDENKGQWFDYSISGKKLRRTVVSASNFFPLYFDAYDTTCHHKVDTEKVMTALENSGLITSEDMITVTTSSVSGQQWDAPSSWPPITYILINGFDKLNTKRSAELAKRLAIGFVTEVKKVYDKKKKFYERYTDDLSKKGEHVIQSGFGWTNSVFLSLVVKYVPDLEQRMDIEY